MPPSWAGGRPPRAKLFDFAYCRACSRLSLGSVERLITLGVRGLILFYLMLSLPAAMTRRTFDGRLLGPLD